jgi:hypothetical protein
MQENIAGVEAALPIASEAVKELHRRFESIGQDWIQLT